MLKLLKYAGRFLKYWAFCLILVLTYPVEAGAQAVEEELKEVEEKEWVFSQSHHTSKSSGKKTEPVKNVFIEGRAVRPQDLTALRTVPLYILLGSWRFYG